MLYYYRFDELTIVYTFSILLLHGITKILIMEITNLELFFFEKALNDATNDLRTSKVKDLSLNVLVFRNLKIISELCDTYRKEIDAFMPDRLRELNQKADMSTDEIEEKASLSKEYNSEVNLFLSKKTNIEFYKGDVSPSALNGIEVNYDSSAVIGFLLGQDEKK